GDRQPGVLDLLARVAGLLPVGDVVGGGPGGCPVGGAFAGGPGQHGFLGRGVDARDLDGNDIGVGPVAVAESLNELLPFFQEDWVPRHGNRLWSGRVLIDEREGGSACLIDPGGSGNAGGDAQRYFLTRGRCRRDLAVEVGPVEDAVGRFNVVPSGA